jgi:hypothetical protein
MRKALDLQPIPMSHEIWGVSPIFFEVADFVMLFGFFREFTAV